MYSAKSPPAPVSVIAEVRLSTSRVPETERLVVVAFVVVAFPIVTPLTKVVKADVQILLFDKSIPQSEMAELPLKEEPERVVSFVSAKRFDPRATPEIVELESIALLTEVHPPRTPKAVNVVGS